MTFDFFNSTKRIVVECQGRQHSEALHYFHGGHINNFLDQLKRDIKKQEFCVLNDISFIEIFEEDTLDEDLLKKLKL